MYAILFAYAIGFVLFPRRVLLILDEFHYAAQALAFARGALTIPGVAPLYPVSTLRVASDHPPGTSLLQAPFAGLFGWQGAAALSVIALVAATLITAKSLRQQQRDPAFAVLVPAFLGSLFFGSIAMSDVPSAAWIAAAVWALFRAERSARWSFAAGLLAGTSVLFRETNAVVLAPFVVGALVRKQANALALIAGGVVGVAMRLGISLAMFDDAFYVRDPGYGFSIAAVLRNLPQYAVILMILFPLGALLPFFYRGPRRQEFSLSVCMSVALYLFYDYGAVAENGRVKGLLLASRFIVPIVPLLAFMAADVWPRWFSRLSEAWRRVLLRPLPIAFAGIAAAAFLIHPALRRQERDQIELIHAIQNSSERDVPAITNHQATLKYLNPLYGGPPMILRAFVTPDDVSRFLATYGKLQLLFLDRSDSEMFRADAQSNADFVTGARKHCRLRALYDSVHVGMRLHTYAIEGCG